MFDILNDRKASWLQSINLLNSLKGFTTNKEPLMNYLDVHSNLFQQKYDIQCFEYSSTTIFFVFPLKPYNKNNEDCMDTFYMRDAESRWLEF